MAQSVLPLLVKENYMWKLLLKRGNPILTMARAVLLFGRLRLRIKTKMLRTVFKQTYLYLLKKKFKIAKTYIKFWHRAKMGGSGKQ